MVMPGGTGRRL